MPQQSFRRLDPNKEQTREKKANGLGCLTAAAGNCLRQRAD
jgi:hypothetical protein